MDLKNENATLKKLRKQQETSLSEMLAHKEELATDEKSLKKWTWRM
jgi:hypothetical protein